ncbi:hypothetical protein GQX74_002446 [Glossina fuscipes]|nr:hypothetical protein GQX74_002446 [Glossina fuscipes]
MLPSLRRSLAFKVLLSIWGLSLSPPTNSKSSEISSSSDISVGPRNSKFAITAASVSNIKVSLGCWIFLAVKLPSDSEARLLFSLPLTLGLTFSSCSALLLRPNMERTRFERTSIMLSKGKPLMSSGDISRAMTNGSDNDCGYETGPYERTLLSMQSYKVTVSNDEPDIHAVMRKEKPAIVSNGSDHTVRHRIASICLISYLTDLISNAKHICCFIMLSMALPSALLHCSIRLAKSDCKHIKLSGH